MKRAIFTVTASLMASCVSAQDADSQQAAAIAAPPAPPPCSTELFHQFDFWIGEWEVFGLNDQKAGDNIISVEENGCLLVERWTSVTGNTGQSYNFVDPGTKKWRQVWVSPGGTIDYAGGLNDDGAMFLEGEIANANGTTAPFTGTWTLQNDGSVRQHFQQYNAETDEWADWFVGIYRRKEGAAD